MEAEHLDARAIRCELDKITASKHFARSPQLRRFLSFAVEEAIQGRGEKLKGYQIAVEAMGRRPDFDPHTDPIVRVQAANLRSKLKDYYETEGRNDRLVIELSAGSYVPVFRVRTDLLPERKAQPAGRRRVLQAGVAAAALGAVVVFLWWFSRDSPIGGQTVELTQLTFDAGFTSHPSVSRDGRWLAYNSDRAEAGNMDIWIQRLDRGGQPIRLTHDPVPDLNPDLSPDGKLVVFRSSRDGGGIYVVPALGGPAGHIAAGGYGPRFSPDGSWIAYEAKTDAGAAAVFVSASGGGRSTQVRPESAHSMWPVWAPDGRHLAFLSADDRRERTYDWWIAPLEFHDVPVALPAVKTGAAGMLRSQELGVIDEDWGPTDWEGNRILFRTSRDNNPQIMDIPISPRTLKLAGPARQLISAAAEGSFRVRRSGRTLELFFSAETRLNHIWSLAIDGAGRRTAAARVRLTGDASLKAGVENHFSLSPDGRRLLFPSKRNGHWNIWRKDLETGREEPVTGGESRDDYPLFSPKGDRFAFARYDGERPAIHVGDGSGVREVCGDCGAPRGWSSENSILYIRDGALWVLAVRSGRRTRLFHQTGWVLVDVAVEPHRRWLALAVDQGKPRLQGYLAPIGRDGLGKPAEWRWFAEETHILTFAWSSDGNRLFYFATHNGFRCLSCLALDPLTKRPKSDPEWVEHFHSFQHYPLNGSVIGASRDRLAVTLAEQRSNIWLARLRPGSHAGKQ